MYLYGQLLGGSGHLETRPAPYRHRAQLRLTFLPPCVVAVEVRACTSRQSLLSSVPTAWASSEGRSVEKLVVAAGPAFLNEIAFTATCSPVRSWSSFCRACGASANMCTGTAETVAHSRLVRSLQRSTVPRFPEPRSPSTQTWAWQSRGFPFKFLVPRLEVLNSPGHLSWSWLRCLSRVSKDVFEEARSNLATQKMLWMRPCCAVRVGNNALSVVPASVRNMQAYCA